MKFGVFVDSCEVLNKVSFDELVEGPVLCIGNNGKKYNGSVGFVSNFDHTGYIKVIYVCFPSHVELIEYYQ